MRRRYPVARCYRLGPASRTRPAHEAVIAGPRRAILGRPTTPAASALENINDLTDHPAIVHALPAADLSAKGVQSAPLVVVRPK